MAKESPKPYQYGISSSLLLLKESRICQILYDSGQFFFSFIFHPVQYLIYIFFIDGDERDDFGQLTEFFCGQEDECTGFNTEIAMKKAMDHVEKNYAVVGILEEMNKTLTVLEHYVPRFFKGALNTYWEEIHMFSKINRNIYKPPVSEATKEIVRRNFTREIEFFEFCKQRLHKQYMALNLNEEQP